MIGLKIESLFSSFQGAVVGGLILLGLGGCTERSLEPSVAVTPVATQSENIPAGQAVIPRLVGVGSCTSSGCHGGSMPRQIVGSEYNIWISADPHSQAHSVLYDDVSLQIVKRLDGQNWNPDIPAYEDPRCLNCHSTTFVPAVNPAGEVLTDGVGCEACHGPAEQWLAEHFLPGFSDADRKRLGMWDTKNLFSRAQICAGCHVGGPGREVNHDLLAAGHPRLQFEMGAYLQALPKHWDEKRDRDRIGGSFEFLVWALGQAATSQAAVRQLAERAAHGTVWPELSEWSCSACHHNLLDARSRQKALARSGGLSGRTIRWDDWNHHVIHTTGNRIAAVLGFHESTATLQETMSALALKAGRLNADRESLAESALGVQKQLTAWASELQNSVLNRESLDMLLRTLVEDYSLEEITSLSHAMLIYDALASLQQSRIDMLATEGNQLSAVDLAITAKLGEMYVTLTQENPAPDAEITRARQMTEQLQELGKLLELPEVIP